MISSEWSLSNGASATRSVQTKAIPVEWADETDSVYLVESVEDWPSFNGEEPDTRGSIVRTADLGTMESFTTFGMEGFILDDVSKLNPVQDEHYVNAGTVSKSGDSWVLKDGSSKEYQWVDGTDFAFWSYAPQSLFTPASFTKDGYSLTGYTVPTTVTSQQDLILAYTKMNSGNGGTPVDVKFAHALSVVRFKLNLEGCSLKSASVSKVSSKGDLTVGKTDDGEVSISWDNLSTPATFSQEFAETDFTDGLQSQSGNKLFFMIPQKSADESKVKISITIEKADLSTETKSAELDVDWQAGKIYTYILSHDAIDYVLDVEGEVTTNYLATGSKTYSVTSNAPWQLQYKTSGSSTWTDATAGTSIDGWIKFDQVSGEGGASPETVTATVTAASGAVEPFETTHDKILREAEPRGTKDAPWDLSMHDIYGSANPSGAVTANCYVISAPGWYAFPLVYGNAITNGSPNTSAYAPSAAAHGENYLTPFKKADGAGISSPFIEGAAKAYPFWEDVLSYALVPEDGCKVLSKTEAINKGLAGCSCGYVMFEVKADALTQGNAVIAVSNGTDILWSWHIWVTDENLDPVSVKNNDDSFNGAMLPVNLGWVSADMATVATGYPEKSISVRFVQKKGDNVKNIVEKTPVRRQYVSSTKFSFSGFNPYWQWGRKDPFVRANADGENVAENTNISGKAIVKDVPAKNHDIAFSIKNPDNFIQYFEKLEPKVWYKENSGDKACDYYNLWNANNTGSGSSAPAYSSKPVKTVYDPCPPGFQIPQGNAFTGFTTTGENVEDYEASKFNVVGSFNKGWNFLTGYGDNTIFFPVSGYRNHWSGAISSVGTTGNIWSDTPTTISPHPADATDHRVFYLTYHKKQYVRPINHEIPTYGFSVRPVTYNP
ncbi:MAG: fimbrillin family protein [Bacteroidales bacterium]|nr:fimbrillin family protein [Bacteroidales bacterium]